MRRCDEITCTEPAMQIGTFTTQLGETRTRAACSLAHKLLLDQAIRGAGFEATWKEFIQPEVRRAAEKEAGA